MAATMAPGKPALENNREWVEAAARLKELEHQHTEAVRDIAGLEELLATAHAQQQGTLGPQATLRAQAAALTAGGTAVDLIDATATRAQHAEAMARDRLLREAIRQQASIVADLTRRVSRSICDVLRPQHRSLVRANVAAYVALAEAVEAEKGFRERLNADGISTGSLTAMPVSVFGVIRDPNSRISLYLRDACKHGFITPDEYKGYTGRDYPA